MTFPPCSFFPFLFLTSFFVSLEIQFVHQEEKHASYETPENINTPKKHLHHILFPDVEISLIYLLSRGWLLSY